MSPMQTIYLTNAASLKTPGHKGPGMIWAAMARPPWRWLPKGTIRLPDGAAIVSDFDAFSSGEITIEVYFQRFRREMVRRATYDLLSPGQLGAGERRVADGDMLICTCACPGSPRRLHRCHLEELAPYLAAAGWGIVLYGETYKEES